MAKKWTVADAPMPNFAKALQNMSGITFTSQDHLDRYMKELNKNRPSLKKRTSGKAIGGPIENPLDKKLNPLYREELGMYGGGAVRKKMYARGGSTRPIRG